MVDSSDAGQLASVLRRLRPTGRSAADLPATGFSESEEQHYLRAYAPVLLWDAADNSSVIEALVTPDFFVQTAESLNTPKGPVIDFAATDEEKRVEWFLDWIKTHPTEAHSAWLDLPGKKAGVVRDGAAGNKQESTKQAIKQKLPCVFGLVQPLGEKYWSLQYWVLFAYNNALNESWHHEGDWLCLEVLVNRGEKPEGPVVAVFYHNHGKVVEALPEAIRFEDDGKKHPRAYLEAGTNEPWPLPGDDGDNHDGVKGIYRSADLGYLGLGDAFGIRPHNGTAASQGFKLQIETLVVNVRSDASDDAKLVRYFPGRWGGTGTHGNDSPQSPMYNDKMRGREFGDW